MKALFPDLVINGETVSSDAVAMEAQNHPGPKGKPGIAWRKAANAIAVRTLLLQEARARRIKVEPEEVAPGRFETEEEAMIRGLLDKEVSADKPTPASVRAEWEKYPEKFRAPPLWEISHILVACNPQDDEDRKKAQVRATVLAGFATSDPKGFAALAARESDCGSKASGGSLGQLGPGDTLPEFETAVKGLSEGEITKKPILTRHGWHIIKMDAVALGAVLPFEIVRPKISDAMEKASWTRSANNFVRALVAGAEIAGADLQPISVGNAGREERGA